MVKAGTVYIEIEGDFTPLEREVKRKTARSAGTAHVDVDADTKSLDRKLDITQGKLQALGRNAMSGMGSGFSDAAKHVTGYEAAATKAGSATDGLGRSFDGMTRSKRKADDLIGKNVKTFGGLSGAVDGAGGAVNALGGGFGKLGATMVFAAPPLLALGGAAAALVSALGPLVGLGPAAAVGMAALGQAAGVAALASIGVGDALKEQLEVTGKAAQAAVAGGEQQRAASRAIAQAQEGVRNATDRAAKASESLTAAERGRADALRALKPAQAEARRALEDMHTALTSAALNERGAVLGLKDARSALAHAQSPQDAQALLDAQERLTISTRNQQDAVRGLVAARERLDELMQPPDALTIADAQDAVADATRGQERAALDLVDAREKLAQLESPAPGDARGSDEEIARAKLAVADAENAIGDASRQSAKAQASLVKLQSGPDQKAVAAAKQDIADAERNVADAAADTAKSEKAIQDAQRGADPEKVAQAKYDVAVAEQALADATRDRARLQKDVTAADKAGVSGSAQVIAAKQQITEADQRLAAAQKDYRDAMRDVARAEQAVTDARSDASTGMAAAAVAAADLNEKLNGLPPAAQAFVRQLVALKPRLDEVRGIAAAGLFPGVTAGIQSAMQNFEPLKRVIAATAEVLGGLAARAGALVGCAGFGRELETIGTRNTLIIDRLGHAAIYVGDAFRHLLVAAGPLATWLAKVTVEWAKNADEAIKAGRQSGALGDFFQKTRNTLVRVVSILGNLAVAFFNVGKAAAPFGRDMLASIEQVTQSFKAWTASIGGAKVLQDFFRESAELASKLMPALAGVLGSLGQMAFRVLPAYIAILNALGPVAGPLVQAFVIWKVALTGVAIATGLVTAAQTAWTAATKIAAGAQWLLNAALAGNPIVLVIGGLVALGAALVLAYTKSETFREIVNGAWTAIQAVAAPVLSWLVTASIDTWNWVKTAAVNVFEFLQPYLIAAFEVIKTVVTTYFTIYKTIVTTTWDVIKTVTTKLWDWFGPFLKLAFEVVKTAVTTYFKVYETIITTAWDAITAATKLAWDIFKGLVVEPVKAAVSILKGLLGSDGLGGWLADKWESFKTGASNAWDAVKHNIVTPIGEAVNTVQSALGKGKDGLVTWLTDRWADVKGVFVGAKDALAGAISAPFEAGLDAISGFTKKILQIISKIPGVDETDAISKITAFRVAHGFEKVDGKARGGAYARTGGFVSQPITLMGEEAPRHPEFVIPTNPAYRKRAQMIALQAARAVGLAKGGIFSQGEMEQLWVAADGPKSEAKVAGAVGMAESSGKQYAVGPMTAYGQAKGLMQILGQVVPGDIFDPLVNFKNAVSKWRSAGGWSPWEAFTGPDGKGSDGPFRKFMGGGGIIGKIGNAIGDVVDALNPLDLINQLPGIGDLPDWMKGVGKKVLSDVGDWIRSKITGVLPGGGGGGTTSGPEGVGSFRGVPMANWVIQSLEHAEKKLGPIHPTSGWRSQAQQDAIRARDPRAAVISEHLGTQYPKGAVDFGGFTDPHAKAIKDAVVAATADFKWPLLPPSGFVDDGHASGTGHKKGGVFSQLPFAGAFATGGVVPGAIGAPAAAVVHGGERIVPPGTVTNVRVFIGDRELTDIVRVEIDEHDRATDHAYAAGVA